eukprot:jgi/Astpho2/8848/fgenesh1_pg.00129_%23_34_t
MQWSLPVVGPLTLTLSGIELHDLRFDGSKTGLVTSDQGTFVLTVEGEVMTVSQGALQVEVAVQNDGSGHPQIASVGHVYMHFEDVDVQTFDAKLAWLYNIVLRLFDQYVKSAIESSVADQVNKLLLGIPTVVKLHGFTLNTSLAGQPEVTADHLRVQDWGEFEMGPDEQCPYERSHGLQQAVMKAVAELLKGGSGASGVHAGSNQVPIALDTDSWASIVPDLAKKYPHQHMMLDAGVLGPLATTINAAHGIVSMGNATLSFTKAGNGTDGLQKLFSLQVSGGVAATGLTVEPNPSHPGNWRLKIHVRLLSDIIAVTVLESNVGVTDSPGPVPAQVACKAENIPKTAENDPVAMSKGTGRVLKGLVHSGLLKPIFAGQTRSYKRARAQISLQETPAKVKPSIREEEAKAWPDLDLGAFYSQVATVRVRKHVNPLKSELQVVGPPLDWAAIFADPQRPLMVDIGCGPGRFVLSLAAQRPDLNLLGVDIRHKLVDRGNQWARLTPHAGRVHFHTANATVSLDSMLSSYPGPLQLFPDPHFKKKHKKRRVVQPQLIEAIDRRLAPGGLVFLQSDVMEVAEAMRDEFELCASTRFSPAQRDSREAASESSSPAQHLSQDPGVPGPQPEPLAAESSSHSYEPLTPQAVSDSISNFEAETQSEAPDKTDRQSWKSSWAQHGWLSQNPLGIPTEMEMHTLQLGKPVYRVLLTHT